PVRVTSVEYESRHQRIRAQREAADRGRLFFFHHLEEQLRDELQSLGMEAGLADIDVIVGRRARAEHEFAEAHRAVEEHLPELVTRWGGHLRSFLPAVGACQSSMPAASGRSQGRAPRLPFYTALSTLLSTRRPAFPSRKPAVCPITMRQLPLIALL